MRFLSILKNFVLFGGMFTLGLFLIGQEGQISIKYDDYFVEIPLHYILFGILLTIIAVILIHQIWRFLWGAPERYRDFLARKRKKKAIDLLLNGFSSLIAKQPDEALSSASLAKKLDPDNHLNDLIAAQSALANNDEERATSHYNKLLTDKRTKFLGIMGLASIAEKRREFPYLMQLLEQAFELRHDSPNVIQQWMHNTARLEFLRPNNKIDRHAIGKHMPKEQWHNYLGLVFAIRGERMLLGNHINEAIYYFKKSIDYRPHIYKSIKCLARIYLDEDKRFKAQRLIVNGFKAFPHRDIAALWLELSQGNNELEHLSFLQKLIPQGIQHYEIDFVLAQQSERAEIWGQAMHHYQNAFTKYTTHEAMQGIQRAQGHLATLQANKHLHDEELQNNFSWLCGVCAAKHNEWQAICDSCERVDTIDWLNKKQNSFEETIALQQSIPLLIS